VRARGLTTFSNVCLVDFSSTTARLPTIFRSMIWFMKTFKMFRATLHVRCCPLGRTFLSHRGGQLTIGIFFLKSELRIELILQVGVPFDAPSLSLRNDRFLQGHGVCLSRTENGRSHSWRSV
jgi:hypothetical protein